ncbi:MULTISPECIES: hypothetical protein [unclassified Clostridium]|uniref:hypothetical protein n=1 Tax=unclassified Clostridium TaxID=2614128 RepID=UPI003216DE3F
MEYRKCGRQEAKDKGRGIRKNCTGKLMRGCLDYSYMEAIYLIYKIILFNKKYI